MEIKITGEPKEIAALVLAVQERQISVDEIMKQITNQLADELNSQIQNQFDSDYDILKKAADNHFSAAFSQSKEE